MNLPKKKQTERDEQLVREVMRFNLTPTPKRNQHFKSLDQDLQAQDARKVSSSREEQAELSERVREWLDSADILLNSSSSDGEIVEDGETAKEPARRRRAKSSAKSQSTGRSQPKPIESSEQAKKRQR